MEPSNTHSITKAFHRHDLRKDAMDEARAALDKALAAAVAAGALPKAEAPAYVVEIPADTAHGELAANLALVGAKAFRLPPRKIAEALVAHFPPIENSVFARIEIAGPGFINFYLSPAWFASVVMAASLCGDEYGRTETGAGQRVNVEFVSANPTGPMHLGNARGGALGDVLAAVLDWAGWDVTREFYINDAGNQINKFGRSLEARYLQILHGEDVVPFPEDGYQGKDIRQLAEEYVALHGNALDALPAEERRQALIDYGLPKNIQGLKNDLAKYRINYDVWFCESSLHESGAVAAVLGALKERGHTYEKEGALWYKNPGDTEKDEVLVRANGVPTYFAADIAYHVDKFMRGFTLLIDVWGADHHGHVARMKNALSAAGYPGDKLDIVLMQFVNLLRNGQPVRMAKRTGEAITLTSLLDEVPLDSARFFFNAREPGSTIEFDLDLAVAQDSENPVYYVQYAHARICSLLRALHGEPNTAKDTGTATTTVSAPSDGEILSVHYELLSTDAERQLIRQLAAFPGEIVSAANGRDPARITRHSVETATAFHHFYTACRIKGEEPQLMQARLVLAIATRNVLRNALAILKISAPETM